MVFGFEFVGFSLRGLVLQRLLLIWGMCLLWVCVPLVLYLLGLSLVRGLFMGF